jgi:hypothetical protein
MLVRQIETENVNQMLEIQFDNIKEYNDIISILKTAKQYFKESYDFSDTEIISEDKIILNILQSSKRNGDGTLTNCIDYNSFVDLFNSYVHMSTFINEQQKMIKMQKKAMRVMSKIIESLEESSAWKMEIIKGYEKICEENSKSNKIMLEKLNTIERAYQSEIKSDRDGIDEDVEKYNNIIDNLCEKIFEK